MANPLVLYSIAFGLSGKEFLIPYLTKTYNRNSQTIYNCLGINIENALKLWGKHKEK
jgi:hypothetical protein